MNEHHLEQLHKETTAILGLRMREAEEEKKLTSDEGEADRGTFDRLEHASPFYDHDPLFSQPTGQHHELEETDPYYEYDKEFDVNDDDYDQAATSDDPYVYSDDSESLSDAYFIPRRSDFPMPLHARAPHAFQNHSSASDSDSLGPISNARFSQALSMGSQSYVYSGAYGSLGSATEGPISHIGIPGSILEDSPVVEELDYLRNSRKHVTPGGPEYLYLGSSKRDRRKRRKQEREARQRQRQLHDEQRERAAREWAVARVRGKPQEQNCKHLFFSIMFIMQALYVVQSALMVQVSVGIYASSPQGFNEEDNVRHLVSSNEQELYPSTEGYVFGEFENSSFHSEIAHQGETDRFLEENTTLATLEYTDDDDDDGDDGDDTNSSNVSILGEPLDDFHSKHDLKRSYAVVSIDDDNVNKIIFIAGAYSCALTYVMFGFMFVMTRSILFVILVFSVFLALAWVMAGITLSPYGPISITGFLGLFFTLGYTIFGWNRVPFGAINLYTAVCAIRGTHIAVFSFFAMLVAFGWCAAWGIAFVGSVNVIMPRDCNFNDSCSWDPNVSQLSLAAFYALSFCWTNTVIKNIVRVTVASNIGNWWYYKPESKQCCGHSITEPLSRGLSSSLGSICFGSLMSLPANVILITGKTLIFLFGDFDVILHSAYDSNLHEIEIGEDEAYLFPEETENLVQDRRPSEKKSKPQFGRWLKCFNHWAYTYIGMYSYEFCEGGEKAIQLFEAREWTQVMNDTLIHDVFLIASILIGGTAGCFAVIQEEVASLFSSLLNPITTAFIIGSAMGFVLSNIVLLGVLGSAVNTVLVCFAAGPFEFERNHPVLSHEMREVWSHHVWDRRR